MKKLITMLFSLAVIASMTVFTSCGGSSKVPTSAEISSILQKSYSDLTEKDGDMLVNYFVAYVDEATPLAKELNKAIESQDKDKIAELRQKIDELQDGKYKNVRTVINRLMHSIPEKVGKSNLSKFGKTYNNAVKEGLDIFPLF